MFNLQIGDNDLVGNKFNGHDLHIYLRKKNIYSDHLVLNKQSDDPNTYVYPHGNKFEILHDESFLKSDITHLHLIHNNVVDVDLLPIMTKLKPTVWSIHDPWALGGHCVHHFDCEKWKTHCGDCPYLDKPFAVDFDDTALRFELKKQAVQNSQISAIVASKWMEEKIRQSPIWEGKKIYRVPFGINHDIFRPIDIKEAKKKLRINPKDFVVFCRTQIGPYKGIDVINETLKAIDQKITVFTVADKGLLYEAKNHNVKEFGWINDDILLAQLYQACDLFLMPSKQEAFGMMAIEAMSCGKLVVALSSDTALPDTINAPECGLVVDEQNYPAEIQRLINHPDEILERGKKSLDYARENYNKDIYVKRVIEVYEDVIKNHKLDDIAKHILEQLNLYRPYVSKKRLPLWYRYLIRPILRRIFPKYKVKFKYDPKFAKK
jgi:glycosyltransferase involved in cell wall biosynthesis